MCCIPQEVVGNHLDGAKSLPSNVKDVMTFNTVNDKEIISMKLKELALKRKLASPSPPSDKLVGPPSANRKDEFVVVNDMPVEKKEVSPANSFKDDIAIAQVI